MGAKGERKHSLPAKHVVDIRRFAGLFGHVSRQQIGSIVRFILQIHDLHILHTHFLQRPTVVPAKLPLDIRASFFDHAIQSIRNSLTPHAGPSTRIIANRIQAYCPGTQDP
jgi:hypothetical protein